MRAILQGVRRPLGLGGLVAAGFGIWLVGSAASSAPAEPVDSLFPVAKFEGSQSCATTGCHGGGEGRNEYSAFMTRDVHRRFVSTLTRSGFIAVDTPLENADCTVCHAPMAPVIGHLATKDQLFVDGFTCETCHGPAQNWLRSHTRYDYSQAQRQAAGLRDLSTAYAQANTCVACHQHLDAKILKNGHPELFFELDGQIEREPPHWPSGKTGGAAQWLTGQAVALREMSWHLKEGRDSDRARWEALIWLLNLTAAPGTSPFPLADPGTVQETADALARSASARNWSAEEVREALQRLTAAGQQFNAADISRETKIRRAQVLTIAVERLAAALGRETVSPELLSGLSQQIRDGKRTRSLQRMRSNFQPAEFAEALSRIHAAY